MSITSISATSSTPLATSASSAENNAANNLTPTPPTLGDTTPSPGAITQETNTQPTTPAPTIYNSLAAASSSTVRGSGVDVVT